jgi:hypothetical protein
VSAGAGRLARGELLAGACAVLLAIDMPAPWYEARGGAVQSAWRAYGVLDVYLLAVIVATLAWLALSARARTPALPVAGSVALAPAAALAAVLVLVRLLDRPDALAGVRAWAWAGLALTLGISAGAFAALRDEGTARGDARARTEALLRERGERLPAPPPDPPT